MSYAVIENEKVVNMVLAPPEWAMAQGWIECSNEVGIGWRYEAGKFLPPERNLDLESQQARFIRNAMLQESDTLMLSDRWAAMSPERQAAWAAYRQALRDLPAQSGFPVEINWPAQPE
jgi:hypothetical protein